MLQRRFRASVALLALAWSCSSGHSTATGGPLAERPLGRAGCQPPSPVVGAEIRGTADTGSLYGLLFARRTPLRAGDEVKIVWRMTGAGDLAATATAPSGQPATLTFGPEPHGGSTYTRPGDEWGTGYLFSDAGCWHLHFARDHATADVWLMVLA